MPLIGFGDELLVAKLGEKEQRAPARSPPPALGATFLPDADESPRYRGKRIAIVAILLAVAIVAILLVVR
jgi:hypothetical protein